MKHKEVEGNWFFVLLLCMLFSYPVFIKAQNNNIKDTTKTDTTKTDTLGYNNINQLDRNTYALNISINNELNLQDSLKTDTTKTDTTKTDTLGYESYYNNSNSYVYNENLTSGNSTVSNISKSSSFEIYPVKYLAQKLKEDIYLKDDQTSKVKDILREYEAKTFQTKGDSEGLKNAANDALKNIEDILMDRQKKEWENAKSEWWASVNKELNLSPLNNNNL
jgi:hypothetical protein